MDETMHLLVTGAGGKLGGRVLSRLLRDTPGIRIRAMTHSRDLAVSDPRLTVVKGDLADRDFVEGAMSGITHVIHAATCKENPERVMDVAVKGMFWLLEAFREQRGRYFILIGGDAAIGHSIYPADGPQAEDTPHKAYPGCYALSKVLEEVLLAQAHIQYGVQGCCLRSPWMMADDDLRYALSFGPDVFGSPRWGDAVGADRARLYEARGSVPLALAADGQPLRRGIIGIDDVVDAVMAALAVQPPGCETFNVAMDEPFDYGVAAAHIRQRFGLEPVIVPTDLHSVRMDNAKARRVLGWTPSSSTRSLVDAAWAFVRDSGAKRHVLYPG